MEILPKPFIRKYGNLIILLFLIVFLILLESSIQIIIFWFIIYFIYLVFIWYIPIWRTELNLVEDGILDISSKHGKVMITHSLPLDYHEKNSYTINCKSCGEDIQFTSISYYDIKKRIFWWKMLIPTYPSFTVLFITFGLISDTGALYYDLFLVLGVIILSFLHLLFWLGGIAYLNNPFPENKIISYKNSSHSLHINNITPRSSDSLPLLETTKYLCHNCDHEITLAGDICTKCGSTSPICVICYNDPEPLEDICQLSCCNSYAHKDHLYDWLDEKSICPYCNKEDPNVMNVKEIK